ncbi:MAG: hypothetical protein AB1498_01515 [bacterium]
MSFDKIILTNRIGHFKFFFAFISKNYACVRISMPLIYDAIDVSILNKISFWDALIVVSAESAKCSILYTEALNQNQVIRNVKVINPFKPKDL